MKIAHLGKNCGNDGYILRTDLYDFLDDWLKIGPLDFGFCEIYFDLLSFFA